MRESDKSMEENLVERVSQLSLDWRDLEMESMRICCCLFGFGIVLEEEEKKPWMSFGDGFDGGMK